MCVVVECDVPELKQPWWRYDMRTFWSFIKTCLTKISNTKQKQRCETTCIDVSLDEIQSVEVGYWDHRKWFNELNAPIALCMFT